MKLSKKIFAGFAVLFFLFLVFVVFDIGRRTTFPGRRDAAPVGPGPQVVPTDSARRDSIP